ncbi:MAG: cation transporter [Clostridia bacterium]|nr:cation transporter [Clostridia bacterium]
MDREKIIIKTSIKGIIANIFLAAFKAVVGFISNSIAIVLDAVNNLSDALSSVITIVGTKLAGKAPDKEHPYGHGRVEYLSAMIISIIVLYAGFTSFIESGKKIIHPERPDYSIISIGIIIVAVFVKIILGLYVKKVGEKVNSESLVDSGKDALMDSIISTSTVVAAIIFVTLKISLEAWLGLIISAVIVKSGIEMLKSTLSQILGERVDRDLALAIKNTVTANENVYGAFDLVLNDYGPDIYLGSIHIEVPDTMTAAEIDELTRKISKEVYEKHSVIMAAIGIYSINTQNKKIIKIREKISKIVHSHGTVIQMHGFYINEKDKSINFDVIIDFADKQRDETFQKIHDEIQKEFPDYNLNITLDYDISD